MKRIALWALVLTISAGVLAGQAMAMDPLSGEKMVFAGERGRGPGGHGGPGRPGGPGGGPGWGRPPPPRPGHHGGSGWGWALGAAVGSAIANSYRPSYPSYQYRPAQPTLVCDAYGNCYYQNY